MRKIGLMLIIICFPFLLTGCWDRTEINDLAIVTATGVDKGDKHKYQFSLQVPLPSSLGGPGSSGGGGGTSGEGPFLLARGTGRNLQQGIEDIQARISRKLYFSHRRVLIIGENLAKEGIMPTLNAVFTQPQSRLSTFVIISKGDAVKLLETQPRMEQYSSEALREMANANINMTVLDAFQDMERPGKDLVIPLAEHTDLMKEKKNGKEVEMKRFALFKGDKLSFVTNSRESLGVLWLLERMKKKSLTFSVNGNDDISVQINDNQVKTNFLVMDGSPVFDLSIRATGILLDNEPNLKMDDPDTYQMVVRKMNKEIKKEIYSLVSHAHSKGIDVCGLGWYLYKNQYPIWNNIGWENWDTLLPCLAVNIRVDADIQRTTNTGYFEKD